MLHPDDETVTWKSVMTGAAKTLVINAPHAWFLLPAYAVAVYAVFNTFSTVGATTVSLVLIASMCQSAVGERSIFGRVVRSAHGWIIPVHITDAEKAVIEDVYRTQQADPTTELVRDRGLVFAWMLINRYDEIPR